jgi:hypothetical protein
MKLFLEISNEELISVDINKDLTLRAKNTNVLDCFFISELGTVVDITGALIFFTVKNKTSDTDITAVLKKDISILTDPTNGEAIIELTASETATLIGNYLYSIKIKLTTGKIYSVAEGTVCFQKELSTRES